MADTPPGAFTVQETSAATGVTVSTLHYWTGPARVITPEIAHPGVQRAPKLFSSQNLVQIATLKILSARGLGLDVWQALQQVAQPAWWDLRTEDEERLVFLDGKTWRYYSGSAEEVAALVGTSLARAQDAVIVNLSTLKREIRQQ